MAKSQLHYRTDDSASMYREIANFVGTRLGRKIANNTYVEPRREIDQTLNAQAYAVRLHSTDVVTYHADGCVELHTGGWQSVTTKERINTNTPHSVRVHQENFQWYVSYRNHKGERVSTPYRDGFTFQTFEDGTTRYYSTDGHTLSVLKMRETIQDAGR